MKGQPKAEMPLNFRQFSKFAMISVPVIFFAIGSHLLYDAYKIFKHQQLCIEVQNLLQQANILSDANSLSHNQTIIDEVHDILEMDDKAQMQKQLHTFITKHQRQA